MKKTSMILPMSETIEPRETKWVTVQPQQIFRPKSLVYVGPAQNFILHDIVIGKNSQFQGCSYYNKTGVPLEMFQPPSLELEKALTKLAESAKLLSGKQGTSGVPHEVALQMLKQGSAAAESCVNNLGHIELAQISMYVRLLVENVSTSWSAGKTSQFNCLLRGETVD